MRTLVGMTETQDSIEPGDLVEKIDTDLDPREVVSVGRDFITIDILGKESPRLPKDNYRVVVKNDGQF